MTDLQIEIDFSDQTGIFDPTGYAGGLTMIGCGGIGASVLPTIVTMGFTRYVLWDDDQVEPRNVASQLAFRPADLYRPKVEVLSEYLQAYGAVEIETHLEKFTANDPLEGLVISGVDSMAARKEIWQAAAWNTNVPLYFDGRIGGEHFTLLVIEPFNPDDVKWYEDRWLFDDEQAAELPCTQRAIVYPAVALGAFMASLLATWSRGGEKLPRRIDLSMRDMFFQVVQ